MVDYTPVVTIIISLGALAVSTYAAVSTYRRGKKTEKITSKWEQIRIARDIFTTMFSLENRFLDLSADFKATQDKTEKAQITNRIEATQVTMAQHLDYFADLVLSNRIEWDVMYYYITHAIRAAGVIHMGIKLEIFGPNIIKLLTIIAAHTNRSVDDLLLGKKT